METTLDISMTHHIRTVRVMLLFYKTF